jgi:ribose/xylose/arabinose/galactoside ABC-type transport system permease subunit
MSLVPAMLLAVAVGAGVGLINGVIIAQLRISPLISSLAMLSVAGGVAAIMANGQAVIMNAPGSGFWGQRSILGLERGTWAFILLALVAIFVLRFTVYGRSLYTVGGNREAAHLAGLRVKGLGVSVYVICGACAAFSGAIAASQLLAASPQTGTDTTLNSVAAVILGGAALAGGSGSVFGTVLGVLLLQTISNGLTLMQISSVYQTVVSGALLLLAVAMGRLREIITNSAFVTRTRPDATASRRAHALRQ